MEGTQGEHPPGLCVRGEPFRKQPKRGETVNTVSSVNTFWTAPYHRSNSDEAARPDARVSAEGQDGAGNGTTALEEGVGSEERHTCCPPPTQTGPQGSESPKSGQAASLFSNRRLGKHTIIKLGIVSWLHFCAISFFHSTVWLPNAEPSITFSSEDAPRPTALIAADIASVLTGLGIGLALEAIGMTAGFLVALGSILLGIVLLIRSESVGMLSLGQVFYSIGYSTNELVVGVIIAHTLPLRMRGIALATLKTPLLLSIFVSQTIILASVNGGLPYMTVLTIMCGIIALHGMALLVFLFLLVYRGQAIRPPTGNIIAFLLKELKRPHIQLACLFGFAVCAVFWLAYNELLPWYTTLPVFSAFLANLCVLVIFKQLQYRFKLWLPKFRWLPTTKLMQLAERWDREEITRPEMKHSTIYSAYVLNFAWYAEGAWEKNMEAYLNLAYGRNYDSDYYLLLSEWITGISWMFPIGIFICLRGRFKRLMPFAIILHLLGATLVMLAPLAHRSIAVLLVGCGLMSATKSTYVIAADVSALCVADISDTAVMLSLIETWQKIGSVAGSTLSDILWIAASLPKRSRFYLTAAVFLDLEDNTESHFRAFLNLPIHHPSRIEAALRSDEIQRHLLIVGCAAILLASITIVAVARGNVRKVDGASEAHQ